MGIRSRAAASKGLNGGLELSPQEIRVEVTFSPLVEPRLRGRQSQEPKPRRMTMPDERWKRSKKSTNLRPKCPLVDFFGLDVARKLAAAGRSADVIVANNVVAHVADQNDFVAGVRELLKDDGMAVVEFPYIRDLIDFVEFDTIYHEHRCYFSVTSAATLFARHGLHLNDVRRLQIHGGSLRLYFETRPSPSQATRDILEEEKALGLDTYEYYRNFGDRVREFREKARGLIGDLRLDGKRIAAYGAAAKGTIMLNFLGLNDRVIEYVVDKNPHKRGKYMPGVRLRIDDPEVLLEDKPDYVLILPWNFRDEIIRQQQDFLSGGGKFVVPIPDLEIVGG